MVEEKEWEWGGAEGWGRALPPPSQGREWCECSHKCGDGGCKLEDSDRPWNDGVSWEGGVGEHVAVSRWCRTRPEFRFYSA